MAILKVFRGRHQAASAAAEAFEFAEAGTILLLVDECAGFGAFTLDASVAVNVVVEESPLKVALAEGDAFTAGDFPFELVNEAATTAQAVKLQDLAGRSYAVTVTGACTVTMLVAK